MSNNINVGSTNPIKIDAVKQTLSGYGSLSRYNIVQVPVNSGVSKEPKSLDETIEGAINRAKNSFNDCYYSFGIEGGLMNIKQAKSKYMNICACAIYDGNKIVLGLSSSFEHPKIIIDKVINQKHKDITNAIEVEEIYNELKSQNNSRVGNREGIVGILTNGRVNRTQYMKQAITMALIQIENSRLYT